MKVRVLEILATKHGVVHPGKIISIPTETVARLGGKVKPVPFDRDRWIRLTRELIAGFGDRDPCGGCWSWIKVHRPELWSNHRAALADLDQAFHTGDEELAEKSSARAAKSFSACVEAWAQRHRYQQPGFEPAKENSNDH